MAAPSNGPRIYRVQLAAPASVEVFTSLASVRRGAPYTCSSIIGCALSAPSHARALRGGGHCWALIVEFEHFQQFFVVGRRADILVTDYAIGIQHQGQR